MSPEIELLKDHRQVGSNAQNLFWIGGMSMVRVAFPGNGFALEQNLALLTVFQKIAAAQKGRLPRTRRADQRNHIAATRFDIDTLQHFERAIRLM